MESQKRTILYHWRWVVTVGIVDVLHAGVAAQVESQIGTPPPRSLDIYSKEFLADILA